MLVVLCVTVRYNIESWFSLAGAAIQPCRKKCCREAASTVESAPPLPISHLPEVNGPMTTAYRIMSTTPLVKS